MDEGEVGVASGASRSEQGAEMDDGQRERKAHKKREDDLELELQGEQRRDEHEKCGNV